MLIGINGGYFPAICRVCLKVGVLNQGSRLEHILSVSASLGLIFWTKAAGQTLWVLVACGNLLPFVWCRGKSVMKKSNYGLCCFLAITLLKSHHSYENFVLWAELMALKLLKGDKNNIIYDQLTSHLQSFLHMRCIWSHFEKQAYQNIDFWNNLIGWETATIVKPALQNAFLPITFKKIELFERFSNALLLCFVSQSYVLVVHWSHHFHICH